MISRTSTTTGTRMSEIFPSYFLQKLLLIEEIQTLFWEEKKSLKFLSRQL